MKSLIVCGSPRKGSCYRLASLYYDESKCDKELILIKDYKINPCLGCDYCHKNKESGCFQNDDMKALLNKVVLADELVFVTPIYWWHVPSQMKAFIDRFYSLKDGSFKGKTFKLIVNGGANTSDIEYELIYKMFNEMFSYLGASFKAYLTFEAYQDKPLEIDDEVKAKIKSIL